MNPSQLSTRSVLSIYAENSTTLLISFGGMTPSHLKPQFEFVESTLAFPIHKIFLRDEHQLWYHRGLPEISRNISETVDFVEQKIHALKPERVIALGNSMGGYAALLFGYLLKTELVIAFSPKSFITPWKRFFYMDIWFKAVIARGELKIVRQTLKLLRETQASPQYFDLSTVLATPNHATCFHIFYNQNSRIDRLNADRINDKPGVVSHTFQYRSKHNLVKELRESGELTTILEAAVAGSLQSAGHPTHGEGEAGSLRAGSPKSI